MSSDGFARAAVPPALCALLLSACSTSSHLAEPDPYDVAEGDYLTPKEFEALSRDEALAYCQELAQEVDIQDDNAKLTDETIAETEAEITDLRSRLEEARASIDSFAAAPADATRPAAPSGERGDFSTTYRVEPGDWLSTIAGQPAIYDDWRKWRRIYEANRDSIRNPDVIFPGQVFAIPRDDGRSVQTSPEPKGAPTRPGGVHIVAPGETLRILAEQAYGSREEWGKIWEVNREKIPNPDRIPVGLSVIIP